MRIESEFPQSDPSNRKTTERKAYLRASTDRNHQNKQKKVTKKLRLFHRASPINEEKILCPVPPPPLIKQTIQVSLSHTAFDRVVHNNCTTYAIKLRVKKVTKRTEFIAAVQGWSQNMIFWWHHQSQSIVYICQCLFNFVSNKNHHPSKPIQSKEASLSLLEVGIRWWSPRQRVCCLSECFAEEKNKKNCKAITSPIHNTHTYTHTHTSLQVDGASWLQEEGKG